MRKNVSFHYSNQNKRRYLVSYVIFVMLFPFIIPPIVLAIPQLIEKYKETCEDYDTASSSCLSESDDESTSSLPSLSGISIGSELSENTFSDLSQAEMCELLGPEVSKDNLIHVLPKDFVRPKNLEHTIKLEVPIGFLRLRRGFLSENNDFWDRRILNHSLQYKK